MQVCIVGSGPAGFYAANFLLANSDAHVDMFERLPTPYGLVRAGIAPDHQHTKAVTRLFEHIAGHERFRFHGNVAVGTDVDLGVLSDHYDAVVLAFGATSDRPLGIPGEHLAGCLTATEFVGWYNGHPDFADLNPELDGGPVVVIGHGNVAADVARVIMSPADLLARTDIADHALAKIKLACVQSVHVVGRKGCRDARFTLPELKQLANIPGVRPVVNPRDIDDADGAAGPVQAQFRAFAQSEQPPGRNLRFHFNLVPETVFGSSHVTGVAFRNARTGKLVEIRTKLVIKCVGNIGKPCLDLPFDEARQRIENVDGRVCRSNQIVSKVYVAGWAKRGATGTVGTNRLDAEATCRLLLTDLLNNCGPKKSTHKFLRRLRGPIVSFSDWKRIDQIEVHAGRPLRPRRKIVRVREMLDVLQKDGRTTRC